ncbi:MAG: hypothetical protein ABIP03_07840 [Aquihabitans sp.]
MDTEQQRRTARAMWHLLEPIHAVTYFSDEITMAYKSLGLKGFWQGYFASRVAPMGPVSGEVCTAVFYNFHPDMVQRALPSAWSLASPEAVLRARDEAILPVLATLLSAEDSIAEAAELATLVLEGCAVNGRALFAGHRTLPVPEDPILHLWWAATLLREHRGDGHVAALLANGIDGVEAHVLFVGSGRVTRELMQGARSWSDEEWDDAVRRLAVRGLVEGGQLTGSGRELRDRIEAVTDDLAAEPWHRIGERRTEHLARLLAPLRDCVIRAGRIPIDNPIGLPLGEPA